MKKIYVVTMILGTFSRRSLRQGRLRFIFHYVIQEHSEPTIRLRLRPYDGYIEAYGIVCTTARSQKMNRHVKHSGFKYE
jgi:hypothetical protein